MRNLIRLLTTKAGAEWTSPAPDLEKVLRTCARKWLIPNPDHVYVAISRVSPTRWYARVIGNTGLENRCVTIVSDEKPTYEEALRDLAQKTESL